MKQIASILRERTGRLLGLVLGVIVLLGAVSAAYGNGFSSIAPPRTVGSDVIGIVFLLAG